MTKSVYCEIVVLLGVIIIQLHAGIELEEQRLITYQRCLLDSHCQRINENSFCFGNDETRPGVCKCVDGYELLSRNRTFFACLKYAGWNEPCEKDIQCYYYLSTYSMCDTTCRCAEGAHRFRDGRCYRSIRLGDFCQTDANCLLKNESFGNCVDGRCECKYHTEIPTEDGFSCVESRNLGELCDNDEQCSFIGNAVCRVSCRCTAGFALSRDETRCLQAATGFLQPCEEEAQCSEFLQGSICNSGTCTCQDGLYGSGSRCVRSTNVGQPCVRPEECIAGSNCSSNAVCELLSDGTGSGSKKVFYSFPSIIMCALVIRFLNIFIM